MPDGFFDSTELESRGRQGGRSLSCASCGLYKESLSFKIPPTGEGNKGILNIGEAPGKDEDRKAKPWQGKVGRILKRTYREFGVDLFGDCVNVNSVNCRPPDNRNPGPHELSCCRHQVVDPAIREIRPRVIVLLGNMAIQSVIGHRWRKDLGGISRWRGWAIPDRDLGAWVCPIFHPSYVERQGDEEAWTIWKQDIERAVGMAEVPFPEFPDERKQVDIVESADRLTKILRRIRRYDRVAFDYETTGLKPHADGHEIVCASVAVDPETVYSFRMPEDHRNLSLLRRFLSDPGVAKTAHNMKFEEAWSRVRLGTPVENWYWDSMLAAHILDNRPAITGLKFQAYVQFGLIDYNSHIEPYLRGQGEGANAKNSIHKLIEDKGEEELLTYCGLDSLLEYRLAEQQMEELGFA